MSEEKKRTTRNSFAEQALKLAHLSRDAPPVLFLCDPSDQVRETADFCPLSGEAGRMAVLSMTFCNPLALKSATVIEGAMS